MVIAESSRVLSGCNTNDSEASEIYNTYDSMNYYQLRKRTINLRKRKQFYCELINFYDIDFGSKNENQNLDIGCNAPESSFGRNFKAGKDWDWKTEKQRTGLRQGKESVVDGSSRESDHSLDGERNSGFGRSFAECSHFGDGYRSNGTTGERADESSCKSGVPTVGVAEGASDDDEHEEESIVAGGTLQHPHEKVFLVRAGSSVENKNASGQLLGSTTSETTLGKPSSAQSAVAEPQLSLDNSRIEQSSSSARFGAQKRPSRIAATTSVDCLKQSLRARGISSATNSGVFSESSSSIGSAESEKVDRVESPPVLQVVVDADLRNSGDEVLNSTRSYPSQKPKKFGEERQQSGIRNSGAVQMFKKFLSTVKTKVHINSRTKSTGMNVEVTDVYIVDESVYSDWTVLDTQTFSGTFCPQSEVTVEPVGELKMTFLSEFDFLDWVCVQEFSETIAYRVEPSLVYEEQIEICEELTSFETATSVNLTKCNEMNKQWDISTPTSFSLKTVVFQEDMKVRRDKKLETIFELSEEPEESKVLPEIPIRKLRLLGYVDLFEETKRIDKAKRKFYDLKLGFVTKTDSSTFMKMILCSLLILSIIFTWIMANEEFAVIVRV